MSAGTPAVDLSGRRLGRNTLWNLLGQGIPLVVAVWAIARLISGLGDAAFGVLGLAWALVAMGGEVGVARAGTRFAATALGRGDVRAARATIFRVVRWQLGLGLAAGALMAVVGGPLVGWLGIEPGLAGEAAAAFRWVSVVLPILTVTAALRGGLEATQEFGVLNAIRGVGVTALYLAPVAVVAAGGSVVWAVASLVPVRAAMAVGFGFALTRRLRHEGAAGPDVAPADGGESATVSEGRDAGLLHFGVWSAVSTVVSPILVYVDRFLLVALASTAAAGVYTAPFEAVTRILLVPAALAATLFPAVASLQHGADRDRLPGLVARSVIGVGLGVGVIAVAVAAFAPALVGFWLGPAADPAVVPVIRWLLVGLVANSVAYLPFSVVQGLGRADLTGVFHLIELPIHLAFATWAILRWGVVGAAIAWSARTWLDTALLAVAARVLLRRTVTGEGS